MQRCRHGVKTWSYSLPSAFPSSTTWRTGRCRRWRPSTAARNAWPCGRLPLARRTRKLAFCRTSRPRIGMSYSALFWHDSVRRSRTQTPGPQMARPTRNWVGPGPAFWIAWRRWTNCARLWRASLPDTGNPTRSSPLRKSRRCKCDRNPLFHRPVNAMPVDPALPDGVTSWPWFTCPAGCSTALKDPL